MSNKSADAYGLGISYAGLEIKNQYVVLVGTFPVDARMQ